MNESLKVSSDYINLLDQVFEIERKLEGIKEAKSVSRNISRIKDIFQHICATPSESDVGLMYHNPVGEDYDETRLDLEASIAGESAESLVVTEVIKPIIRYRGHGITRIVRKGVVVVQSKNK